MRIGVDLMGSGIAAPQATSALKEAADATGAQIHVYATAEVALSLQGAISPSVTIEIADDYIRMDEPPTRALIAKPRCTLVRAVKDLEQGKISGLVTLGSTGAIIGAATLYLPTLIKRPFLLAAMPSLAGTLLVGDVGGTIQPRLTYFKDLALISTLYFKAQNDNVPIRLGLLNIGEEATKGTGVHREAYFALGALADSMGVTFIGNIEPHNAFNGSVNVLVTDGFTGNIFLKTAEGAAAFIFKTLGASLAPLPAYSGAFVAGVDAVIIKCHGHSSKGALCKGIEQAVSALQNGLLDKIKSTLIR